MASSPWGRDSTLQTQLPMHQKKHHESSRHLLVSILCLIIFTCCATIFGFISVADSLRNQGEYAHLCTDNLYPCKEQTLHFNKMYIIGVSVFFVSYIFYGVGVDLLGPRVAACIGISLYSFGTLLLCLSSSKTFDAFLPAIVLLGRQLCMCESSLRYILSWLISFF
jgi:hypothetical protein